jgi:predicted MPP superfamily phosphohydrolase
MSRVGLTGVHALPMNRRWVDIHRRAMPLKDLDPAFEGLKIVQISDLHYSPVVWGRYLAQFSDWINDLNPDVVVVTGDLITGGYPFARRVSGMLGRLQPRLWTICTLCNHDYIMFGKNVPAAGERRANFLETCLVQRGMTVLRNQSLPITVPGAERPLMIVGLDDEWSGHSDPQQAFANVDPSLPVVCLNHNPADCEELLDYPWQWMLCGHTHGRQLATGPIGRRLYPHRYRNYTHGYYAVRGRHLYVNRGLSYGQRAQHWCRPEITVFKLRRDDQNP